MSTAQHIINLYYLIAFFSVFLLIFRRIRKRKQREHGRLRQSIGGLIWFEKLSLDRGSKCSTGTKDRTCCDLNEWYGREGPNVSLIVTILSEKNLTIQALRLELFFVFYCNNDVTNLAGNKSTNFNSFTFLLFLIKSKN